MFTKTEELLEIYNVKFWLKTWVLDCTYQHSKWSGVHWLSHALLIMVNILCWFLFVCGKVPPMNEVFHWRYFSKVQLNCWDMHTRVLSLCRAVFNTLDTAEELEINHKLYLCISHLSEIIIVGPWLFEHLCATLMLKMFR